MLAYIFIFSVILLFSFCAGILLIIAIDSCQNLSDGFEVFMCLLSCFLLILFIIGLTYLALHYTPNCLCLIIYLIAAAAGAFKTIQ